MDGRVLVGVDCLLKIYTLHNSQLPVEYRAKFSVVRRESSQPPELYFWVEGRAVLSRKVKVSEEYVVPTVLATAFGPQQLGTSAVS